MVKAEIGFENLSIKCIIGVYPEEREIEQEILVNLRVCAEMTQCLQSDSLQHTIDYSELSKICTLIAQQQTFHLLETYAHTVLEHILKHFKVDWGEIEVRKKRSTNCKVYFVRIKLSNLR